MDYYYLNADHYVVEIAVDINEVEPIVVGIDDEAVPNEEILREMGKEKIVEEHADPMHI